MYMYMYVMEKYHLGDFDKSGVFVQPQTTGQTGKNEPWLTFLMYMYYCIAGIQVFLAVKFSVF